MNNISDAKEIFFAALEQPSPQNLASYLDEACGPNAELRERVGQLLRAHEQAGQFLGGPAPAEATIDQPSLERLGTQIGPYKLLQQIGEGGMGVVYMAEQSEPVQRKVALKVIKPGMDSRQVIARFEAERQALAMMDHVNIARVLDAGATEAGRPYFVMELVHGVPITKYCDDNRLTPRQRLELFVPVCQAIQHAHQKGIIHRDIKLSNVMVTLYDGKPVPKVIDFGVAKATEQKLTERTLFTQYGTMVSTLEYMNPEQAEMSALGVDTPGAPGLLFTLANTGELLSLVNRSGNRPSEEGAANVADEVIALCRQAGFRKIRLRGDTAFTLTQHLDRWDAASMIFQFGYDAKSNLKIPLLRVLLKAVRHQVENLPIGTVPNGVCRASPYSSGAVVA